MILAILSITENPFKANEEEKIKYITEGPKMWVMFSSKQPNVAWKKNGKNQDTTNAYVNNMFDH